MIVLNEYKKCKENEYIERDNLAVVKLAKELEKLTKEDIYIKMNDNHLSIHITEDFPINFRHLAYQKQYSFGLWYHLDYINHEDLTKVEKNYTKPNNIGVLNQKKVNDWIIYHKAIYKELVKRSQEKKKKIQAFITNFQSIIKSLKDTEEYTYFRVGMDWDKKPDLTYNGCITRKGLRYEFEILNTGYIKEDITVKYLPDQDQLKSFLKMSNNKL